MKSNLAMVLDFLRWSPGHHTLKFPDGMRYGWDGENLCCVLDRMEYNEDGEFVAVEEIWTVTDLPFNYINDQCKLMTATEIIDLAFHRGRIKR